MQNGAYAAATKKKIAAWSARLAMLRPSGGHGGR